MKPGDRVRITTSEEVIEGLLLPRPEILDDSLVVKLDTGYNIGISRKRIKKEELVKKHVAKATASPKVKRNKDLPDVSLLSFGGTISSKVDYSTGGVSADYTADDFVRMCPELLDIANFNSRKVASMMSEDMQADDWKKMARAIAKELDSGVEGVIATQGTDTMHFSTAAMSFMLQGLGKPVVFTAA